MYTTKITLHKDITQTNPSNPQVEYVTPPLQGFSSFCMNTGLQDFLHAKDRNTEYHRNIQKALRQRSKGTYDAGGLKYFRD